MEIILAHYHKEVGTRANRVFRRVHDHDAALSEIFQKWRDYFLILETQGPTRSDGDGVEEETSAQRYGFLSHLRSPVGIRADKRRRGGSSMIFGAWLYVARVCASKRERRCDGGGTTC